MITNNAERVYEDAPLKFLELIQLLRAARLEDLEQLWSQYRNKPAYRWFTVLTVFKHLNKI